MYYLIKISLKKKGNEIFYIFEKKYIEFVYDLMYLLKNKGINRLWEKNDVYFCIIFKGKLNILLF